MATIKYIIRSKSNASNIYLRYSFARGKRIIKKTGLIIDSENWNHSKGCPKPKNDELKALKTSLDKLKIFIEEQYNKSIEKGIIASPEWLDEKVNVFFNFKPLIELDILTNYIDKYIQDSPLKINQKNEIGLSEGRIKNLKLFKNTILRYEKEKLSESKIVIKKIDSSFVETFSKWLFSNNYSVNYVGKNLSNLKTICLDAQKNGIETSNSIRDIKKISSSKSSEEIIILNDEEQEKIKNTELKNEALINARKWLLLGCQLGQRGSDLLNITEKNIQSVGLNKIIELKQEKTGTLVAIPLNKKGLEIINSGLPYKISLTKFNEYIKEICKKAEINEIITGKKKDKPRGNLKEQKLEKFNFVSSHICRRSFATNYYSKLPTPTLMKITGHKSESTFLKYIGKTSYDYALQMLDYFNKNDL